MLKRIYERDSCKGKEGVAALQPVQETSKECDGALPRPVNIGSQCERGFQFWSSGV